MGDDISVKSMPPWSTYDSLIPEMPLSTSADFFNYPMTQGCTCNGVTGPCPRHLEEIRYQALNTNISGPSQLMSSFPESRPQREYEGSNAGEAKIPQQQQHQSQGTLHHQPSHHSSSTSISSTPLRSVACVPNLYDGTCLNCVVSTINPTKHTQPIATATAAQAAVLQVSPSPLH